MWLWDALFCAAAESDRFGSHYYAYQSMNVHVRGYVLALFSIARVTVFPSLAVGALVVDRWLPGQFAAVSS